MYYFLTHKLFTYYCIIIYYINTNEIPDELSRENLVSSHVTITCYLHTRKYQCCYCFMAPFTPKNYQSEMVLYFIGVYIINRTLHGRLEIWNFSSRIEKIFHSFAALTREIFFNTRRESSYLRTAI